MNLPTAKQNVCVESYVLSINMCTCRNTRKQELENTYKPDVCCALKAQGTCVRVMREHWQQKPSVFTHSVSISRILYSVTSTFVFTGFHLI